MREVKYIVRNSMIRPDEVIFAGTFKLLKDKEFFEWRTRGDVTQDVIDAFVTMYLEKTKKTLKESPKAKGTIHTFIDKNFDIKLSIEKKKKEEKNG